MGGFRVFGVFKDFGGFRVFIGLRRTAESCERSFARAVALSKCREFHRDYTSVASAGQMGWRVLCLPGMSKQTNLSGFLLLLNQLEANSVIQAWASKAKPSNLLATHIDCRASQNYGFFIIPSCTFEYSLRHLQITYCPKNAYRNDFYHRLSSPL